MPRNLRGELRRALSGEIADLEHATSGLAPSRRDLVRLQYARQAMAVIEGDRKIFPEIERIAVGLWQSHNGDHVSPMSLDPSTRRVMLVEAAKVYVIVHQSGARHEGTEQ